ncbi:kinase-like protein [Aulographum hederae CBS 113979]|uniref:non-specific serine/threonine protein kinase n=1 Tax=Aulographum hederae CBS 113979 TaxID=1176131 RepID=A0A6G1HCD1_9PEZI|nr:kinase-like protein [Aulographum hederae CBS 113979]
MAAPGAGRSASFSVRQLIERMEGMVQGSPRSSSQSPANTPTRKTSASSQATTSTLKAPVPLPLELLKITKRTVSAPLPAPDPSLSAASASSPVETTKSSSLESTPPAMTSPVSSKLAPKKLQGEATASTEAAPSFLAADPTPPTTTTQAPPKAAPAFPTAPAVPAGLSDINLDGFEPELYEDISGYSEGGYHPVNLGDVIRKFRIIDKLGFDDKSITWLARYEEVPLFPVIPSSLINVSNGAHGLGHGMPLRGGSSNQPGRESLNPGLTLGEMVKRGLPREDLEDDELTSGNTTFVTADSGAPPELPAESYDIPDFAGATPPREHSPDLEFKDKSPIRPEMKDPSLEHERPWTVGPSSRYVNFRILRADEGTEENLYFPELLKRRHDGSRVGSSVISYLQEAFHIKGPNGVHLCLVYELVGPTLQDLMDTSKRLRGSVSRDLSMQLTDALVYLHKLKICHGALTPSNICLKLSSAIDAWSPMQLQSTLGFPRFFRLKAKASTIDSDNRDDITPLNPSLPRHIVRPINLANTLSHMLSGFLRLTNFDLAYETQEIPPTLATPLSYAAPEVLLSSVVGPESDVWALGCCIFALRSGQDLFQLPPPAPNQPVVTSKPMDIINLFITMFGYPPSDCSWEVAGEKVSKRRIRLNHARALTSKDDKSSKANAADNCQPEQEDEKAFLSSLLTRCRLISDEYHGDLPPSELDRSTIPSKDSKFLRLDCMGTRTLEYAKKPPHPRLRRPTSKSSSYFSSVDPSRYRQGEEEKPTIKISTEEAFGLCNMLNLCFCWRGSERAGAREVGGHEWLRKVYAEAEAEVGAGAFWQGRYGPFLGVRW